MALTLSLLRELATAMKQLEALYERRDENIRETNRLMIEEHNLKAQINRINVDIVQTKLED